MITVSFDGVQEPLLIDHTRIFCPLLKPVTPDVGLDGTVTVAEPLTTDHVPLPLTGELPESVVAAAHTSWSAPAFAGVGVANNVIMTVSCDGETDRKSTRLNSSHSAKSRMPSSA